MLIVPLLVASYVGTTKHLTKHRKERRVHSNSRFGVESRTAEKAWRQVDEPTGY